ncbi:hypothetical protein EHYA_06582 [Embleya hyalina]|uniref:Uncharacterized protein n=1 Tax=Embleya hyalina TaxID=516124 RepID=A0A401YWB3_9ACTN|nr:hypothetical protein EHYA_06582 [Embleya hyalina]
MPSASATAGLDAPPAHPRVSHTPDPPLRRVAVRRAPTPNPGTTPALGRRLPPVAAPGPARPGAGRGVPRVPGPGFGCHRPTGRLRPPSHGAGAGPDRESRPPGPPESGARGGCVVRAPGAALARPEPGVPPGSVPASGAAPVRTAFARAGPPPPCPRLYGSGLPPVPTSGRGWCARLRRSCPRRARVAALSPERVRVYRRIRPRAPCLARPSHPAPAVRAARSAPSVRPRPATAPRRRASAAPPARAVPRYAARPARVPPRPCPAIPVRFVPGRATTGARPPLGGKAGPRSCDPTGSGA